jgi:hypothetical protein
MSLEVLEGDSSGGDENIARGNRLHSELVREVKTLGFDSFAHKYRTNLDRSSDVMISFALKQADEDAIRRQFLKGPSIKRDKFTSKYWKVWNEEKNLLEDLTYNKVVAAENAPSSRQSSKPKRTIKKPSTASSIAGNGWRASTVHGGKFAYPKVDSHFDFHVLGNIDVKYLLKNSLGRDYPRHHSELSDDPIPQVHEHIKGGAVSTQSRHHPSERNETSRCDFMDQTPSIQPSKGYSFTSSKRFPSIQQHSSKLTTTRAQTTASVKRNHDYKPVVSLLPGSSFSKSDRFTEKSRNSVKILYESPILESLGGVETGSPEEGATGSLGGVETGMETKEFEYFPNDSPGPGQYTIDRIFEDRKQTYNATTTTASDFNAIVSKYRSESELKSRQLHGMNVHGLTRLGVMGLHCSRQEHVLYGACLDGKCFSRSQEEKVAVICV